MKIILTIIFIHIQIIVFGQSLNQKFINELENGIHVRNLRIEYVETRNYLSDVSISKLKKDIYRNIIGIIPKEKYSFNFLRFYDLKPNINSSFFIGKVFMSERYFEKDLDSLFKDKKWNNFKTYANGYYMICKVFTSKEGIIKINIYPNYAINVCQVKDHTIRKDSLNNLYISTLLNLKNQDQESCSDFKEHYEKLKEIVAIKDYELDDFWVGLKKNERRILKNRILNDLEQKLKVEYKSSKYTQKQVGTGIENTYKGGISDNELSFARTEVNFNKNIKCFRIHTESTEIKDLILDFSKYTGSTDRIQTINHSYKFYPSTEVDKGIRHIISSIESEDREQSKSLK